MIRLGSRKLNKKGKILFENEVNLLGIPGKKFKIKKILKSPRGIKGIQKKIITKNTILELKNGMEVVVISKPSKSNGYDCRELNYA